MKLPIKKAIAALSVAALSGTGFAAGELNLFNWGNYTNPELISKFEQEHDVKVTITDYDSNDSALAKVKAGGHGYDLVVPSANYMQIWINEGLLQETRPDQMENFKHMHEDFADPQWDPGSTLQRAMAVGQCRHYCRYFCLFGRYQYRSYLS